MPYSIVILESAEQDLQEIKRYVIQRFSSKAWKKTSTQLKATLKQLQQFPYSGNIPQEIALFELHQFQQVICDMNRIVYEIEQDKIFIHMIVDVRRDMKSLLMKRLIRKSN